MSLPKIEAPRYTCKLPVCAKEVEFRPFLSQEERILLMASESKDPMTYVRAMKEVVSICTYGKVDVDKLAPLDLEYMFLNLRMKAVGESVTITSECKNEKCKVEIQHTIDFSSIDFSNLDSYKANKKIEISKGVGIIMEAPSTEETVRINEEDIPDSQKTYKLIKASIDVIYDAEQTYKPSDYSEAELDEFIGQFPSTTMKLIGKFFDELPKMVYEAKEVCEKCKHVNEIKLDGVGDFFT